MFPQHREETREKKLRNSNTLEDQLVLWILFISSRWAPTPILVIYGVVTPVNGVVNE